MKNLWNLNFISDFFLAITGIDNLTLTNVFFLFFFFLKENHTCTITHTVTHTDLIPPWPCLNPQTKTSIQIQRLTVSPSLVTIALSLSMPSFHSLVHCLPVSLSFLHTHNLSLSHSYTRTHTLALSLSLSRVCPVFQLKQRLSLESCKVSTKERQPSTSD